MYRQPSLDLFNKIDCKIEELLSVQSNIPAEACCLFQVCHNDRCSSSGHGKLGGHGSSPPEI